MKKGRSISHLICHTCQKEFTRLTSRVNAYMKNGKLKLIFCSLSCMAKLRTQNGYGYQKGEENPSWNGGISIHAEGYIKILLPDHPNCDDKGYIFEHRVVMEKILCRFVTQDEIVHHINGDRKDNRPENL